MNYVFTHHPEQLVAYHFLVMNEMKRRGYNPDKIWYNQDWRGSALGEQQSWVDPKATGGYIITATTNGIMIYPEHNDAYLQECIQLLKDKNAPINWEEVSDEL